MPPIAFPIDPVWQWVLAAAAIYVPQLLHAKGIKLPFLELMLSFVGGAKPAAAPTPLPTPASDAAHPVLGRIEQLLAELRAAIQGMGPKPPAA